MLRQGNILYLDLHKTGSTTIRQFLIDEIVGDTTRWRKHVPARQIAKQPDDVWLMSVRNPLDYYVSLWSYGREYRYGVYRAFKESRRDELYGSPTAACFRDWLTHLFRAEDLVTTAGPNANFRIAEHIRQAALAGIGLFTLRWVVLATAQPSLPFPESVLPPRSAVGSFFDRYARVDVFARLERLSEDLATLDTFPQITVRDGAFARLQRSSPRNPSTHGLASELYDAECRQLVLESDHEMFRRHYSDAPALVEAETGIRSDMVGG